MQEIQFILPMLLSISLIPIMFTYSLATKKIPNPYSELKLRRDR